MHSSIFTIDKELWNISDDFDFTDYKHHDIVFFPFIQSFYILYLGFWQSTGLSLI